MNSPKVDSSETTNKPRDLRVYGLHADIRRALYAAFVRDYPTLEPVEDDPSPAAIRRLRLVFWLESLVEAGARFDANDLAISLWEALAHLKGERNRFDRLIMDQKAERRKAEAAENKAQDAARKLDNIPGPGQSLFSGSRSKRRG